MEKTDSEIKELAKKILILKPTQEELESYIKEFLLDSVVNDTNSNLDPYQLIAGKEYVVTCHGFNKEDSFIFRFYPDLSQGYLRHNGFCFGLYDNFIGSPVVTKLLCISDIKTLRKATEEEIRKFVK